MDAPLLRLFLLSRCSTTIDAFEFQGLYDLWSQESLVLGISGALVACEPYFLQMIEGPKAVVKELHTSITRESRHAEVHAIHEETVPVRVFDRWMMTAIHMRGTSVDFALMRRLMTLFREAVAQEKDLPFATKQIVHNFQKAVVSGYETAVDLGTVVRAA
jgi:hypothetical protein